MLESIKLFKNKSVKQLFNKRKEKKKKKVKHSVYNWLRSNQALTVCSIVLRNFAISF